MKCCPLFYFNNFFNWNFGWSPNLLVHVYWSKDCCRLFFFFLSILLNFLFFGCGCPMEGGCPSPGAYWAYPRAGLDCRPALLVLDYHLYLLLLVLEICCQFRMPEALIFFNLFVIMRGRGERLWDFWVNFDQIWVKKTRLRYWVGWVNGLKWDILDISRRFC